MQPEQFCRDAAAPAGSNLYYATLFQPPAGRRALFALFALLGEVAGAVRDPADPAAGRLRLAWWHEEIGRAPDSLPRHPVGIEIGELLRDRPGLDADLRAFIAAAAALPAADPPATFEHWIERLVGAHGKIWAIAARHVAGADDAVAAGAARIGALLAALEDIQHLPQGLRAGRCILPARDLERHSLAPADFNRIEARGRIVACLHDTLTRLGGELREQSRRLDAGADGALLFAGSMAQLGAALCEELARDPALLLERRTALTPIRKLWIAWRTRFKWRRPVR